jgi:hypothetical protein
MGRGWREGRGKEGKERRKKGRGGKGKLRA